MEFNNYRIPKEFIEEPFLMDLSDSFSYRSEDAKKLYKIYNDSSWKESTIISCSKFYKGLHKFSVIIISSQNKKIFIGICSENFEKREKFTKLKESIFFKLLFQYLLKKVWVISKQRMM